MAERKTLSLSFCLRFSHARLTMLDLPRTTHAKKPRYHVLCRAAESAGSPYDDAALHQASTGAEITHTQQFPQTHAILLYTPQDIHLQIRRQHVASLTSTRRQMLFALASTPLCFFFSFFFSLSVPPHGNDTKTDILCKPSEVECSLSRLAIQGTATSRILSLASRTGTPSHCHQFHSP